MFRPSHAVFYAGITIFSASLLIAQAGLPTLGLPCTSAGRTVLTRQALFTGASVADPYQWLENGSKAETRSWIAEQQQYTEKLLSSRKGMQPFARSTQRARQS